MTPPARRLGKPGQNRIGAARPRLAPLIPAGLVMYYTLQRGVIELMADTTLPAREYFKARQRQWRAEGKCNDCAKPPRPGKVRCQDCQDQVTLAVRRHRVKQNAKK